MTYSFRVNSHSEVDYLRIIDENKDAWAFVVGGDKDRYGEKHPRLYVSPTVYKKAKEQKIAIVPVNDEYYLATWFDDHTKDGWLWQYAQKQDVETIFATIARIMTPPKHKVTVKVLPAKQATP